jgi:hypothetical protein
MGQMFAPIGQAVIGGLATSTVLTLALTPTLYAWFDDISLWISAVRERALALGRMPIRPVAGREGVVAMEGGPSLSGPETPM